ncbi:MAG: lipocalin family protein [Gelidibacter sp.]|nr:lipocalin family protein [Gelidibacter sp.]
MKKVIFSLLAIAVLALTSCSKDDDSNSSTSLTGTWKLTAWNSATGYDINNDGTASTNILNELDCYNNETVVFSANNTAMAHSTSYADITAEITTGTTDEYTYTVDCVDEVDSFALTWSLNGNTITFDEGTPDEIVATLSGNTFSLLVPEGLVIYDANNVNEVVIQDLTLVYTKQ